VTVHRTTLLTLACALAIAIAPGCGDAPSQETPAATIFFDADAAFGAEGAFFDFPYPSDLRLTPEGTPDVAEFPDPGVHILAGLRKGAGERRGFPLMPVGYFRFTEELAPRASTDVVGGGSGAPLILVDIDPASPERGSRLPVVAHTHTPDPYVPEGLLAVAPRPGIVLAPNRRYAFVVTRDVGLASGAVPSAPPSLAALARGETPSGEKGAAMAELYAPLWETLDREGPAREAVVAATVFTTGDVVAETAAISDRVLADVTPSLESYALEPDPSGRHPGFCHVTATITLPQFQRGTPKFDTEGLFELDPTGAPIAQRDETIPVSLAVPRRAMPAGGFPLILYLHGSGGVARQHVDGGDAEPEPGVKWPSEILAARGFAVAGSSLPISPERVPGAGAYDYINLENVIAMRDTFRQGVIESRLFLTALERARIAPEVLADCEGLSLPDGEAAVRFSLERLSIQGQSMGAMYVNLLGAVEPRVEAAVPTGAGGYWMYFILETKLVAGAGGLLSLLLRANQTLTFLHPAMHIAGTALEAVDPMVSASRLGRRSLEGHPARSVYVPFGSDDSYFPASIQDAMTLAYGHPRAGDEIWPSMREAQSLVGLGEPVAYPIRDNLRSSAGAPYTGATVQYDATGFDGHGVYRRLEPVMHQFSCFHSTFREQGTATIVAPAPLGSPCLP
jgi:hypothetical protein